MKKILIALTENVNMDTKEEIEIVSNNIQYKEGILEILELNKNINYILFSDNLLGQIGTKELTKKIIEINKEIIIFIFVNNKKQFIKNNKDILNNKNIKLINNINDEKLNEIFIKKQDKILKENNNIKKEKAEENKIISISGTSGVGKSITTLKIAKYLKEKNKKILLVDLDYFNNSMQLILGINNKKEGIKKVNNKINYIKYNKNINILNIIKENKNKYNYILIDTSSEVFFELTKEILKISDTNIFLIEPNLVGIEKANNLLNIYLNKYLINKESIKILINKYNKYSIKYEIIKNIFYKFKIIGKIKINEKYDLVINKNNLNYLLVKKNNYLCKKMIKRINMKIKKIKGEKLLWN